MTRPVAALDDGSLRAFAARPRGVLWTGLAAAGRRQRVSQPCGRGNRECEAKLERAR